jgi:hypothetical protein
MGFFLIPGRINDYTASGNNRLMRRWRALSGLRTVRFSRSDEAFTPYPTTTA